MVKRLLIVLLIVCCSLCLTTCDLLVAIFSLSPFPGYLAQAVAAVDMYDEITGFLGDNYSDWDTDVYVLDNGTIEAVFLVVRKHPGNTTVYVFDTSLNLLVTHQVSGHRRIGLVEAAGVPQNFVVGGGWYSGTDLSILNAPIDNPYPSSVSDTWHKFSFAHAGRNYLIWNEFDQLAGAEYGPGWASTGNGFTTIEFNRECRLVGFGYEDAIPDSVLPTIETVYLFTFSWDSSGDNDYLRIIRTDANEYPGPIGTADLVPGDLLDSSASDRIYDVRDEFPVYYTRKGVVAGARTRGTFRLLNLEGDVLKIFFITSDRHTRFDFDIDGKYYYLFNPTTYRLYKAETGF